METKMDIPSLDVLPEVAAAFVESIGGISVIAYSGEMGAGKTTFIQSLCKELGVREDVNSPSFSLVNEYFTTTGESLYHFDLYRIENPEELFDLGYEEYFFSGNRCFIEWPEKASFLIPDDALMVSIDVREDGSRELKFELPGG
jgi:tRNA threonylcarbamoyladenosine biosynthesis protein TsaE